jgi:hypothetical protein
MQSKQGAIDGATVVNKQRAAQDYAGAQRKVRACDEEKPKCKPEQPAGMDGFWDFGGHRLINGIQESD